MNKTEYLIKKGQIPDPANGSMWIVQTHSYFGVSIHHLLIWEKFPLGKNIRYKFKESPYEFDMLAGELSGIHDFGESCYNFGCFDEQTAKKYYEAELIRYEKEKNEPYEHIPATG